MNLIIRKLIRKLSYNGCFNWMPDIVYLKLLFKAHMDRKLDLEKPETFNEKLQWMKIYDRNPMYTVAVDKYLAKKFVADIIGSKYIVKTLGVWENFDEINFEILPSRFVIKCTHDCGGLVICKNKDYLDKNAARKKIERSLKTNYYFSCREWPYKNVKPRIIAEEFIGDVNSAPIDYKFFTFNGEIDSVMICKGREFGHPWFYFYDLNWQRKRYQYPELEKEDEISKPENFDEMVCIVRQLAEKFIHARIDLYNEKGKIYFGEITLFNQAGFDTDITYDTDLMWGKKLGIKINN